MRPIAIASLVSLYPALVALKHSAKPLMFTVLWLAVQSYLVLFKK